MSDSTEERTRAFPVTKAGMIEGLGQVDIAWITMGDESNAKEYVVDASPEQRTHAYANFILSRVIRRPQLSFEQVEALNDDQVREIAKIAGSLGGESDYLDLEAADQRLALYEAIQKHRQVALEETQETMERMTASPLGLIAPDTLPTLWSNPLSQYADMRAQWYESLERYDSLQNGVQRMLGSLDLSTVTAMAAMSHYKSFQAGQMVNRILELTNPTALDALNSRLNTMSSLVFEATGASLERWQSAVDSIKSIAEGSSFELYSSLLVSDSMSTLTHSTDYVSSGGYIDVHIDDSEADLYIRVNDIEEQRAGEMAIARRRMERAMRLVIGNTLMNLDGRWSTYVPHTTLDGVRKKAGGIVDSMDVFEFLEQTTLFELFGIVEQKRLWSNHFEQLFVEKSEFISCKNWLTGGRNTEGHSNNALSLDFNLFAVACVWLADKLGISAPFSIDADFTSD